MSDDTMLSHLADRFVTQRENLATEALAFLLMRPSVATAFERHARRFCPDLAESLRYETQQTSADDGGIPDLVGTDAAGRANLLVEAKFSAALTGNQPVTYMRRLAIDESSRLLLFLVPTRRTSPVWAEVQHRCNQQGMELSPTDAPNRAATWANVTVAITTWSALLDDIEHELNPSDDRKELTELAQLRGLCERDDREAFVPFTHDEMGGTIGQRMLDLDSLLTEAVAILQAEGLVDLSGLKWSAGQGWFGRYLRFGEWVCLLHVNFTRWGRQRPTPLWLRVTKTDLAVTNALAPLKAQQPSRLLSDDGRNLIPIMISAGGNRDEVMAEILEQLRHVGSLLTGVTPVAPDESTVDSIGD